jgi:hypothetical protein
MVTSVVLTVLTIDPYACVMSSGGVGMSDNSLLDLRHYAGWLHGLRDTITRQSITMTMSRRRGWRGAVQCVWQACAGFMPGEIRLRQCDDEAEA